jgi:carbamate kinase
MGVSPSPDRKAPPLAVVALGGNALLARGEPPEARTQARAAQAAASRLAGASAGTRLVITHGNGPQVGLLALMAESYGATDPYPLDVLDSETEGQIGYVLELALANAMPDRQTVSILTRVVVAADDPAFESPSKFIGPVYAEADAAALAQRRGWTVKPDGHGWRRVVPSPEPHRIVPLAAVEQLVEAGYVVVCTGGGGIPVTEGPDGHQQGVEAVIDKDLASALLAVQLHADSLLLVTDVDGVYADYGTPTQRQIVRATPAGLRAHRYAAGSMGPKVEAACRFVEQTGGRGVIGSLDELDGLLAGHGGTEVLPSGPSVSYQERNEDHDRAA